MESLLEHLNIRINSMLDECSTDICPTVYDFISTDSGRDKIVKLIQKKIVKQKLTIGEAVNSIEREFSANSYD